MFFFSLPRISIVKFTHSPGVWRGSVILLPTPPLLSLSSALVSSVCKVLGSTGILWLCYSLMKLWEMNTGNVHESSCSLLLPFIRLFLSPLKRRIPRVFLKDDLRHFTVKLHFVNEVHLTFSVFYGGDNDLICHFAYSSLNIKLLEICLFKDIWCCFIIKCRKINGLQFFWLFLRLWFTERSDTLCLLKCKPCSSRILCVQGYTVKFMKHVFSSRFFVVYESGSDVTCHSV